MTKIYVAHRLFALHDRILGARVAHSLTQKFGQKNIFLPYCDSHQQMLTSDRKGKEIFDHDISEMNKMDILVAILHGPSLDDGINVEIGYAYASGVPVVALTTDFDVFSRQPSGPATIFPDPLAEIMCTRVVRLHEAKLTSKEEHGWYQSYAARHEAALEDAIEATTAAAVEVADSLTGQHFEASRPVVQHEPPQAVYLEPSPYYARDTLAGVASELTSRGLDVRQATRLDYVNEPLQLARKDLEAALTSRALVLDVSGPEGPPGACLLLGAALAHNQERLVYTGRPRYTQAPGFEPNARNLMVLYGADLLTHDIAEICDYASRWT